MAKPKKTQVSKKSRKAVARRITGAGKVTVKPKAKSKPKPKPKPSKKRTVKPARLPTLGHKKLEIAIEKSFGGNISACARFIDIVMPALHRWVNSHSIPLYSSRKKLLDNLKINPADWVVVFDASKHADEVSAYTRNF